MGRGGREIAQYKFILAGKGRNPLKEQNNELLNTIRYQKDPFKMLNQQYIFITILFQVQFPVANERCALESDAIMF